VIKPTLLGAKIMPGSADIDGWMSLSGRIRL
jgi:hypothetical protein